VPLAIDGEGSLWFFTREVPGETDAEGKVNVAFARPDAATYVSVAGRASLVRDAARAAELWSDRVAAWFPEGPQDPQLVLLRVDVDDAQFWDASASRMVRVPPVQKLPALGAEVLGETETGHVTNPQFPGAVV
jgi:general stress protein 26